jgi:hypothetical protein
MRLLWIGALVMAVSCGGDTGDVGDGDGDGDGDGGDPHPDLPDSELETTAGCAGIFNPDQVLAFSLELDPGDWATVQADTTNSIYVPAQMTCNGGDLVTVAVRKKRSDGAPKVGLKVDINRIVDGQSFSTLKKMSWENGIGEGSTDGSIEALASEVLAWRLMHLSPAITGRAAFMTLEVNGEDLGVYANVEQVDKRFLRFRVGNDSGWLYKISGSDKDGYKTNETVPNPYEEAFCFWNKNGCPMPSAAELATSLPQILDIEQVLTVGAVNALIANTDAPILKANNYIHYDYDGGVRLYFPWDLDTAMRDGYDVFTGTVPGGVTYFVDALFSNWESDYARLLEEMLAGPLTLEAIEAEIDRIETVAGAAFAAEPFLSGSAAGAASALRSYWQSRHPEVVASVEAH